MKEQHQVGVRFVVDDDGSVHLKKIASSTEKVKDQFKKASLAVKTFKTSTTALKSATAAVMSVKGALVGLAASVGGVYVLQRSIRSFIDDVDKFQKLSIRLNESTQFLSEMSYVSELAGVGTGKLMVAIEKFGRALGDTRMGLTESEDALKAMGLYQDVMAGKIKSLEQVLPQVVDHFTNLKDQSLAAAEAAKLFGRGGVSMLQIFRLGSDAIEQMREELRMYGASITQDVANTAAEAADSMTRFSFAMSGFRNVIAVHFLPYMTVALNSMARMIAVGRERGELQAFGEVLLGVASSAGNAIMDFAKVSQEAVAGFLALKEIINGSDQNLVLEYAEHMDKIRKLTEDRLGLEKQLEVSHGAQADANREQIMGIDARNKALETGLEYIKEQLRESGPLGGFITLDMEGAFEEAKRTFDQEMDKLRESIDKNPINIMGGNSSGAGGATGGFLTPAEESARAESEKVLQVRQALSNELTRMSQGDFAAELELAEQRRDELLRMTEDQADAQLFVWAWYYGKLAELQDKNIESAAKVTDVAKESMEESASQMDRIAEGAGSSIANTFSNMALNLTQDFDNIGEEFSDMVSGMLRDIARLTAQQLITNPLVDWISSGLKSAFSFVTPGSGGDLGLGSSYDISNIASDTFFGGGASPFQGIRHCGGPIQRTGMYLMQEGEYVVPRMHSGGVVPNDSILNDLDWPKSAVKGPTGSYDRSKLAPIPMSTLQFLASEGITLDPAYGFGIPYYYYDMFGDQAEAIWTAELIAPESASPQHVVSPAGKFDVQNPKGVSYTELSSEGRDMVSYLSRLFGENTFTVVPGTYGDIVSLYGRYIGGSLDEDIRTAAAINAFLSMGFKPSGASGELIQNSVMTQEMAKEFEWLHKRMKKIKEQMESEAPSDSAFDYIFNASRPFINIPKSHGGRLASDELITILQRGEAVIPKDVVSSNRDLIEALLGDAPRMHSGGTVGGSGPGTPAGVGSNVRVQLINETGVDMRMESGGEFFDGEEFVKAIVLKAIRTDSRFKSAIVGGMI